MVNKRTGVILKHLRQLAAANAAAELTDRQLLDQFAGRHDQGAFEALLRRHGPMVLSVALRVLSNAEDAEDVLQATFLTLARRASSIRKRDSAASWLHGVALRIAMKTRAKVALRCTREKQKRSGTPSDPLAELTGKEICRLLDEELIQLPEDCRGAVVLCLLEGKTRDEAALHLGMSLGTLRRRLQQGRELLHGRLRRRGLALSIVLSATTVLEATASAALPIGIVAPTVKAATLLVAGKAITGVISARVIALTEGIVNTMLMTKYSVATILVAGILVMAAAGTQGFNTAGAEQPDAKVAEVQDAVAPLAQGDKPLAAEGQATTPQKHEREALSAKTEKIGAPNAGPADKGLPRVFIHYLDGLSAASRDTPQDIRFLPSGCPFSLLLTNTTKDEIHLWKPDCPQGDDAIRLEFKRDAESKEIGTARMARFYTGGSGRPRTMKLTPGDSLIYRVDLSSYWSLPFVLKPGGKADLLVRAVYESKPNAAKKSPLAPHADTVWDGRIETGWERVRITNITDSEAPKGHRGPNLLE